MTVTFSWANVVATLTALAGAAGSIITPIWGAHLASEVQAILMGLSAVLVAIPAFHATSVVATTTKAKAQQKLDIEKEASFYRIHLGAPLPEAHTIGIPDIPA